MKKVGLNVSNYSAQNLPEELHFVFDVECKPVMPKTRN